MEKTLRLAGGVFQTPSIYPFRRKGPDDDTSPQ